MDAQLPDFVIERPQGELALLWQLYAAALDKEMKLKEQIRKMRYAKKENENQTR